MVAFCTGDSKVTKVIPNDALKLSGDGPGRVLISRAQKELQRSRMMPTMTRIAHQSFRKLVLLFRSASVPTSRALSFWTTRQPSSPASHCPSHDALHHETRK
jgi:hypothetical protein